MSFDLKADIKDLLRLNAALKYVPQGLETAVARALNKTILGARTDAKALIRRDYNIKAGTIAGQLKIRRANNKQLSASLYGSASYGIPMLEMSVLPRRVPSTVRNQGRFTPAVGISAIVKKGKRTTFPGAFVARMQNGHVGVFRRDPSGKQMRGKNEPAIKGVFAPTPIKLLAGERYDQEMEEKMETRWDKNIQHEAEHVMRQFGLIK